MIVTSQNDFDAVSPPMGTVTKADLERAARLKRLRAYMGFGDSGPRFAAFLGVDYKRYNNLERGFPLSGGMTDIMVRKCPGVTSDWLRYGEGAGLSIRVATALGELPTGSRNSKISAD